MMKPDLKVEKKENLGRDGISIMDARNKKEVESESVERERGKDDEDDGNYETSPEPTDAPVAYEEILNEDELQKLMAEFNRLKNSCYLDHAGATLYSASQLESYFSELQSSLYSNPHSRNPSSTITTDAVDHVRNMVLRHFGTNSDDYTVIFTSGATAGLKLVAESFQFNGGLFTYLEESHTSVVGMRELVNRRYTDRLQEEKADPTKSLSKSSMTKLMDPKFYCGKWESSSPCQNQCDEIHGTSCWIHQNHHYRQQQHRAEHDEDHGNSISLSKTQRQDSSEDTCIISPNSSRSSSPGTKLSNGKDENVDEQVTRKNALVAYPAQCNFSGFKYPLEWIPHLQNGRLECISSLDSFYIEEAEQLINPGTAAASNSQKGSTYQSSLDMGKPSNCKSPVDDDDDIPTEGSNTSRPRESNNEHPAVVHKKNHHHKWFVLLDAASYVATNALDLSLYPADFVVVSFYKMFGFPTGLGALIVRNESAHILKKQYFGGGTVNIQVPSQPFHVKRTNLHERFEDGTIAFLSILAIRNGLDTLSKLCRSMDSIRERTFRLARYFYKNLSSMSYGNGQRVAKVYSDTEFTSSRTQGPVVTFNLLRSDGGIIGYSEMEQIAYLHDVHLRYGCFCNPGACRRHLNLKSDEVIKQYEAGHVCGDLNDLIDGKPTGAIRVSIGYMTSKDNLDFLLRLIYRCWIQPENFGEPVKEYSLPVSQPEILSVESTVGTRNLQKKERKLLRIFVYPIKSCAPFEVPKTWAIGPRGLLYDREWLIVNSAGVPLTQKREPRLCQLKPKIDISNRKLVLSIEGYPDVSIPLEINKLERGDNNNSVKAELCTSKVCGDTVMGLDCGLEVNNWLSDVLGRPGLKLIRMSPDHQRKPKNALDEISLANHSQFLLLSMGSLRRLAHKLIEKGVVSYLIPSWEEALAFEGHEKGNQQEEQANGKDQEDAAGLQLEQKMVDVLIERFRGNFIIGCPNLQENDVPFEEDSWDDVTIGDLLFKSGGPCMRCATICTDQQTGERGPEPLLTLSAMRNGRATFGIHLYNIPSPPPTLGDNNPSTTRNSSTITTSSLLSSSASSLSIVSAQQSISPTWEGKVHTGTIKTRTGNSRRSGSEDEPLQENGIATVPSGRYSVEKNKTPLEKLHSAADDDEAHTVDAPSSAETDFQRTTPADDQALSAGSCFHSTRKDVPNSGIKLKNQQLSSNSSSQSFTLSKSSSAPKLGNSSISIANQVQVIHIGDPVQATATTTISGSDDEKKKKAGLVSRTSPTSSSMTKIHTTSSEPTCITSTDPSGQHHLPLTKNSSLANNATTSIHGSEKYNSSFSPSGGVKSPIFRGATSQLSSNTGDTKMNGESTIPMKTLIESID